MLEQRMIEEILQLPIAERVTLLKKIEDSLREENLKDNSAQVSEEEQQKRRERRHAAINRLRGALKTDSPPPTDEEIREDYTNYLAEKYS